MKLTTEILKELLDYNPETGEFRWKCDKGSARKGEIAGSIYGNGYRYIQIESKDFRAGRLAWLFMTGVDSVYMIEHKDTDKSNDRFENLRLATNSENQANRGAPKNNTSGTKGIRYEPERGKWIARIMVEGKAKNLGRYFTKEEAAEAYRVAAVAAWGEFARTA